MSVSTSDDPVQAVIDVLDSTTNADWTNAGEKPPVIERQEESSPGHKSNVTHDAVYVYAASDRSFTQEGNAQSYTDFQRVSCDIWTVGGGNTERWDQAEALAQDVRDILFDNVNDNQATTNFGRFRPVSETDLRSETTPNSGDHARKVVDSRIQVRR